MVGEPGRERILSRKLEGVSGFDYVVIDCAPSLGLLNQNSLLFCDEAFVPVSCDYLGIEGLKKIMATINTLNEVFDHDIEATKIIPTMYDARLKTCKLNLAKLQNEFYALVSDPIRINSKLKEAPEHSKPIYEYARSSNGSKDYRKLVDQVMHDEASRDDEETGIGIHEGGMVVTTIF
jgi:chromosome partitioning protein